MASQTKKKLPRRRYTAEFKIEALGLAEQVSVVDASNQLGLHESQLYAWPMKARYEASRSETEKDLANENARLKRQLAKKDNALAIFHFWAEIMAFKVGRAKR